LGEKWESQAEEILVTAAKELDPGRLRYATIHLRHCLEPDGVLADANKAYERRFVHLSETFGGIYRLDGQLDAEGGAALQTAIDALMRPPSDEDRRGASERRAGARGGMGGRPAGRGTAARGRWAEPPPGCS